MPRRRNLFQDIVAILHTHMAGEAEVEESAMLADRITGIEREVDVVIRSLAAGHPVTIAVEATSARRRATVEWVEQMTGKHAHLPSDKLVLVSEAGFTPKARELAERIGAVAVTPEDLEVADPSARIVGRLPSLWPKLLSLTPERFRVSVERPDGGDAWFRGEPDHVLFAPDGRAVATLNVFAHMVIRKRFVEIADQLELHQIANDLDARFRLEHGGPHAIVDGERMELHVRHDDSVTPTLHRVASLLVDGAAHIEVRELPLRHMRLGDVHFAHGQVELAGRASLVVVSEDDTGGKLTVRPVPARGGQARRRLPPHDPGA